MGDAAGALAACRAQFRAPVNGRDLEFESQLASTQTEIRRVAFR